MVGVAQLVEPRIVIPVVVGSSPIIHPIPSRECCERYRLNAPVLMTVHGPLAQLVEQVALNHLVEGSSPSRPTKSKGPRYGAFRFGASYPERTARRSPRTFK